MTILFQADIVISLPRRLIWSLIIDHSARHLWQPDVVSATLESGYGGGKGCQLTLQVENGGSSIAVPERVTRSRDQDYLVAVQSWPKHQVQNKFILSSRPEDETCLTLQKRYKRRARFALFGNEITIEQLETSTTRELLEIKNLSAKIHDRIAEQAISATQNSR